MSDSYKDTFNKAIMSGATASLLGAMFATAATGQDYSQESQVDEILLNMGQGGYVEALATIPEPDFLADFSYTFENDVIGDIIEAVHQTSQKPEEYSVDTKNGNFLSFGKIVPSVVGEAFTKFCNGHPTECTQNGEEELIASRDIIPLLGSVNAEFKTNFVYALDEDLHGEIEKWQPAVLLDDAHPNIRKLAGDCEDYAISLMEKLNSDVGVDYSSMSIAIVDPKIEGGTDLHALLMVRTEDGDIFLDNNGAISRVDQSPYELIQAQAYKDKSIWQSVSRTPFGVEPTSEMLPEIKDVPLPRPRPSNGIDI